MPEMVFNVILNASFILHADLYLFFFLKVNVENDGFLFSVWLILSASSSIAARIFRKKINYYMISITTNMYTNLLAISDFFTTNKTGITSFDIAS